MDAQVTLTQTAEIFRLNEMVIRMDAELQDVRNKLHHREMGVEEALIRSSLLLFSSSRVDLWLLDPNVHWHTTDGMQRTARIHLESLSYLSPTAHSLVSGCRCLEVSLSAVVIPRLLRMRANLSLIFLKIRVAECSKMLR